MKLNKKLLVATAVSAMMMVACSEDSKSSTEPENETPSSEVQNPTSSAEPGSATGSSGSALPILAAARVIVANLRLSRVRPSPTRILR